METDEKTKLLLYVWGRPLWLARLRRRLSVFRRRVAWFFHIGRRV